MPKHTGVNDHTEQNLPTQKLNDGIGSVPAHSEALRNSVTELLARFVASMSGGILTPELSDKLKALLLDYLGVTASAGLRAESSQKFVDGITSFSDAAEGRNTVLTKGAFTIQVLWGYMDRSHLSVSFAGVHSRPLKMPSSWRSPGPLGLCSSWRMEAGTNVFIRVLQPTTLYCAFPWQKRVCSAPLKQLKESTDCCTITLEVAILRG